MAARLTVCLALLALLLAGCGAACGPGQTCVPDAGVSVALPAGWSVKGSPDKDELLRAESSSPSVGIILQRGDAILEDGSLRTLEEVEAAVAAEFSAGTNIGFGLIDESVMDRVTLPIGPAVRDRLTWTRSFILSYSYSGTAYWFFVDGRLLDLEYDEAWGEGGSSLPSETEPAELRAILDSLRTMTPEMHAASQTAALLPWLFVGGLALLVVGATAGVMAVLRRRRVHGDSEWLVREILVPLEAGALGSLACWVLVWVGAVDRDGILVLLLMYLGVGVVAGGLSADGARIKGLIAGLVGVWVGTLAGTWSTPDSPIASFLAITLGIACVLFVIGYGITSRIMADRTAHPQTTV
jgi:hypothetical protein